MKIEKQKGVRQEFEMGYLQPELMTLVMLEKAVEDLETRRVIEKEKKNAVAEQGQDLGTDPEIVGIDVVDPDQDRVPEIETATDINGTSKISI